MNGLIENIAILLLIFLAVFVLILVARFILVFLLERSYQRYVVLKNLAKKAIPSKRKKYEKEEEVLKRSLEIPRAHSELQAERMKKADLENESGSYELMESEDHEQDEMEPMKIVDFVKPIGFFTSMILGQKLTYLVQSAQALNKRGKQGFWVSMIEAKDRAAGRQHGRSR